MIKLKITMSNGNAYRIMNFACNSIKEFVKTNLCPHGTFLIWYAIDRQTQIKVDQIVSIEILSSEESNPVEVINEKIREVLDIQDLDMEDKNTEVISDIEENKDTIQPTS